MELFLGNDFNILFDKYLKLNIERVLNPYKMITLMSNFPAHGEPRGSVLELLAE